MEQIITIVALIISIILHEMAHAHAANALGDPTARLQGRLSPNPLVHMDPLGSFFVPVTLFFASHGLLGQGLIFGWAKPVPYNPYNFSASKWAQRWGEAIVAVAGPIMNLLISFLFIFIAKFATAQGLSEAFVYFSFVVAYINLVLAIFNLLPLPLLDGSKILMAILPFRFSYAYKKILLQFEALGFLFSIAFVFLAFYLFSDTLLRFVNMCFSTLAGLNIF
jgi:Zn-dependent protease